MSELKVDKVSPRTGNYVALNTVGSKNIIINGDMSIAQRGTSESGITSTGYYTCDRQRFSNNIGTWTMSQDTDVPSGQGFATSLKLDCTTATGALNPGSVISIQQLIEGQNLQYLKKGTANAESLTLSFWVKTSKTGTYIIELFDRDNSRHIGQSYTVNASNTWEKKILTFPGDTTGTLDNDNTSGLEFVMWLAAGSTFTSGTLQTSWGAQSNGDRAVGQVNLGDSASNEWYVTGIQLEAGTTASDFEFLPHDVNAQRCLRYYEGGDANAPAIFGASVRLCETLKTGSTTRLKPLDSSFLVIKRATPTVTLYAGSGYTTANRISVYNNAASTETVTSISNQSQNRLGQYINVSTTASNSETYTFYYEADAEL